MLYRNAASNYGTHIEEKSNQRPGLSRQIPILPGAGLLSTGSQGSWATGTGTGTGKGTGMGLGLLLHPPQVGRGQRRPAGGADALSSLFTGTLLPICSVPALAGQPEATSCWCPPPPRWAPPSSGTAAARGGGRPWGPDAGPGPGPERRQERGREPGGAPGASGSPGSLGEPRELGGAPGPAERGAPGGTLPAPGDGR